MKIVLKKEASETINHIKRNPSKKEIGGVLLGFVYDWGVEVETLTFPSKNDISGFRYFIRKKLETQKK